MMACDKKINKVCVMTKSTLASLPFKHGTVKFAIVCNVYGKNCVTDLFAS